MTGIIEGGKRASEAIERNAGVAVPKRPREGFGDGWVSERARYYVIIEIDRLSAMASWSTRPSE